VTPTGVHADDDRVPVAVYVRDLLRDRFDAYLAALPPDQFPATHAHAEPLAEVDRDAEFVRGVELLLDAIETLRGGT
jgi:hypothetical protein